MLLVWLQVFCCFFNPFVSAAKRKAPSPVEIEMEKYESDIRDTIVKIDNRLNKR